MYAGRIVETGPADAVMRAPAHPYTAALIDCVPVLGGGRRVGDPIAGQPPPTDALPPGCAFAPRCPRVQPQCTRSVSLVDLEPGRRVACNFPLEAAGKRSPRAGAAHG
jgi:peptide/nickel transport system permease protein